MKMMKMTRSKRVLCSILMIGVLVALLPSAVFASSNLPPYIVQEAEEVSAKVNALQNDSTFTIMGLSDLHYDGGLDGGVSNHQSVASAAMAASLIADNTEIDLLSMFGDYIVGAETSEKGSSAAEYAAIHNEMADVCAKVPNLWLRGNHDQLLYNQSADDASFTDDEMYEFLGKYNTISEGTGHRGEYGYVDFDEKQIRVIYLNTSDDSEDESNHDLAKKNFMTQTQVNWVQDTLSSTDPDYDIVIMSHIPLYNNLYSWGRSLIKAIDNYNDAQNSSGNSGNVIALLNGHSHNFASSCTPKGVPIITIPPMCYDRYNEYATSEWAVYRAWGEYDGNNTLKNDPVYRSKTMGTAEDTSFNVVVIDRENHKIHAVNYGMGIDREFVYADGENGYQPNGPLDGFVQDETGWRYFDKTKLAKGFFKVDGNLHYFDYETGYAPAGQTAVIDGRTYTFTDDQGSCSGAWDNSSPEGRRYYYSDDYYRSGFYDIDGSRYYFDDQGYAMVGKRAVKEKAQYLGAYEFDQNGVLIGNVTGVFTDSKTGVPYYAEDGTLVKNKLYFDGTDYYYAGPNYELYTSPHVLTAEQTGGVIPAGEYEFGPDGKIIFRNGAYPDKFNSSLLTFYLNGVRIYDEGLYEYNGDYYYVRSNGLLLTWDMYISKMGDTGLPAGNYSFGADGKMRILNGPVPDTYNPQYLTFYKDGIRIYDEGLYEYNGKYYYVRSNGLLLTWGMRISKMGDTGLPAGEYQFNAAGELQLQSGPVPDAYNPQYLTFYKDGIRIYDEGLYEYNGKYYYVRSNGLLLTWGMKISKMGDTGLPAGEYQFNAAGELQLQSGPVPDAYNPKYLTFYKDGIRIYEEGLYEYEGKYYYVRSNGLLLTWGMRISKMGDTGLPAGEYQFNDAGELQLQSGPVPDAFNPNYLTFYKDGIRIYEEGLYEYEGDYYYVRSNGLLLTWGMKITKMGDTGLPAGYYEFGSDGKMVR